MPTELDYDADGGIGYRAPGIGEHGAVFPFGHGLGYSSTRCVIEDATVRDGRLRLLLGVTNPGRRDTVHVAQLYAEVAGEAPEFVHVARIPVPAGGSASAAVEVEPDAFARWDGTARRPVDGGHRVHLGTSSAAFTSTIAVTVEAGRILLLG